MNTTPLNGSVVNSPDITKRAIAADFTLLLYSRGRSLVVGLLLWMPDQFFDALAHLVLEGGAA